MLTYFDVVQKIEPRYCLWHADAYDQKYEKYKKKIEFKIVS